MEAVIVYDGKDYHIENKIGYKVTDKTFKSIESAAKFAKEIGLKVDLEG